MTWTTRALVLQSLLVSLMVLTPGKAIAVIFLDATTEITEESVMGTCFFSISDLEPYAAMNTDCQLTRDGIQKSIKQLPGVQFGWPRSPNSLWTKSWFVVSIVPQANSEYCTNFFDVDEQFGEGNLMLAHHSDSNQNVIGEGESDCQTAEPIYRVFYQTLCIGPFDDVVSLGGVVNQIFSYRLLSSITICHEIAVEGSQ